MPALWLSIDWMKSMVVVRTISMVRVQNWLTAFALTTILGCQRFTDEVEFREPCSNEMVRGSRSGTFTATTGAVVPTVQYHQREYLLLPDEARPLGWKCERETQTTN